MKYPSLKTYERIIKEKSFFIQGYENIHLSYRNKFKCGTRSVVFKMYDEVSNKDFALKCYLSDSTLNLFDSNDDINQDFVDCRIQYYSEFEEYFKKSPIYFVPFKHIILSINSCLYTGNIFAVLMEWIEGQTLDEYLNNLNIWIPNKLIRHETIFLRFIQIASDLLSSEFAHGNIKPENIIIQDNNDIKLIGYDNLYVPSLRGRKSYFDLVGVSGKNIEYSLLENTSNFDDVDDLPFNEEYMGFEQQYDEYMDSIPLVWITINLKFYLKKIQNGSLSSFLLGKTYSPFLFPCGMDLKIQHNGVLSQLLLISEDLNISNLLSLYLSALKFNKVDLNHYITASLNVSGLDEKMILNYYQLGNCNCNIHDSYYVRNILKNICINTIFSFQELFFIKIYYNGMRFVKIKIFFGIKIL
jgi:hypothetical protein